MLPAHRPHQLGTRVLWPLAEGLGRKGAVQHPRLRDAERVEQRVAKQLVLHQPERRLRPIVAQLHLDARPAVERAVEDAGGLGQLEVGADDVLASRCRHRAESCRGGSVLFLTGGGVALPKAASGAVGVVEVEQARERARAVKLPRSLARTQAEEEALVARFVCAGGRAVRVGSNMLEGEQRGEEGEKEHMLFSTLWGVRTTSGSFVLKKLRAFDSATATRIAVNLQSRDSHTALAAAHAACQRSPGKDNANRGLRREGSQHRRYR